MNSTDHNSIELLKVSLNEAQMTVRAYDTKAQIVGVGYIFALGIVIQIGDLLPAHDGNPIAFVLLSWLVVVFPIFHFGHVLYPTRKTAPKVSHDLDATLQRVLYVDTDRFSTVDDLRSSLAKSDPVDEYCFELLKTSKLRELKRRRFLRGLISTAVAFFVLFLSHVARSML